MQGLHSGYERSRRCWSKPTPDPRAAPLRYAARMTADHDPADSVKAAAVVDDAGTLRGFVETTPADAERRGWMFAEIAREGRSYSGVTMLSGMPDLDPNQRLTADNWHRGFGQVAYGYGRTSMPLAYARTHDAVAQVKQRGILDHIEGSDFAVEPGGREEIHRAQAAFVEDVLLRRVLSYSGTGLAAVALRMASLMLEGVQVYEVVTPFDPDYVLRVPAEGGGTEVYPMPGGRGATVLGELREILPVSISRYDKAEDGGWDITQEPPAGDIKPGEIPRVQTIPSRHVLHLRWRPVADDPAPYGELRPLVSRLTLLDVAMRMLAVAVRKGAMGVPLAQYTGGGEPNPQDVDYVAQMCKRFTSGPHEYLMAPEGWSITMLHLPTLIDDIGQQVKDATEAVARTLGMRHLHVGEDHGVQALHESVSADHEKVLNAIVRKICDGFNRDPDGDPAKGRRSIIQFLIEANWGPDSVAPGELPRLVHRGFRSVDPKAAVEAVAAAKRDGLLGEWTPADVDAMRGQLAFLPSRDEAAMSVDLDEDPDDDDDPPEPPEPSEPPEPPQDAPEPDEEPDDGPDDEPIEAAERNMTAPAGVRAELRRGLQWHEEGHSGDGLKPETVAWARRLANGEPISEDKALQGAAWFARHEQASKGEGFSPGQPGYPSPGRVAWALWGGNAGKAWMGRIAARLETAEEGVSLPALPFSLRSPPGSSDS